MIDTQGLSHNKGSDYKHVFNKTSVEKAYLGAAASSIQDTPETAQSPKVIGAATYLGLPASKN